MIKPGCFIGLLLSGLILFALPVLADIVTSQRMLEQLSQLRPGDSGAQAIVQLYTRQQVPQAVARLEQLLAQSPQDRTLKIYFGYGQLLLAAEYWRQKNYLRAAELAKQGYFYLDEAAESPPDNWRIRYLRARYDAFLAAFEGRCVIALSDTGWLQQQAEVPLRLLPMISLMQLHAATTCHQPQQAAIARLALAQAGITADGRSPFITSAEIADVLQPLLEPTR
ncbi:hypothetical protein [Winslowiella iniecta]|uniref:hypothetical protein n=1 Tax=Winslowiella iniecta TaxID=1560201 RepID=UPI00069E1B78|nr:hypothetical protein [Winslowiella iniecta]